VSATWSLPLVLVLASLEARREVVGGVRRDLAAEQVEARGVPEVDVLLDRVEVDARPALRASSLGSFFMSSQARLTTRPTPVSPTNMWCASSVSMKRVVRESGSKPTLASARSWYLPSRSVNIVNM
jgi:hypothetical protein